MKKGTGWGKQKQCQKFAIMGLPGPEEIKRTTSWPKASTWPPAGRRELKTERGTQTSPLPAALTSHLEWGWGRRQRYRPRMEWDWGAVVPALWASGRHHLGVTNASAAGARREREERAGRPQGGCRGYAGRRTRSPPYPCPGIPPPLSGASSAQDPRGRLGTPESLEQNYPRSGRLCPLPGPSRPPPRPGPSSLGSSGPFRPVGERRSFGRPRIMGNQNADWPPGPRRGLSLLCGLGWPSAQVSVVF